MSACKAILLAFELRMHEQLEVPSRNEIILACALVESMLNW